MKKLIEFKIKGKIKAFNHELVYGAPSPFSLYLFLNRVINDDILQKEGSLKRKHYIQNKFYYLIREAKLLKSNHGNVIIQKRSVYRLERDVKSLLDIPVAYVDLSIVLEANENENIEKRINLRKLKNQIRFMGYLPKYFDIKIYSYDKEDKNITYNDFLKKTFRKIRGRLIFKEEFSNVDDFFEKLKDKENPKIPTTIGYRLFGDIKDLKLFKKHSFAEPLLGLVNFKSVFSLNDFSNKYFQFLEKDDLIIV